MLETLGLIAASGLMQVAAEPTSIRIDLVAHVPVVCSTAVVLSTEPTPSGLRAALAGSCNADHVVTVTIVDDAEVRAARLNGENGMREQGTFRFLRRAYFSPVSALDVDLDDKNTTAAGPGSQIVVEISPA
jgi:hypothetical protein